MQCKYKFKIKILQIYCKSKPFYFSKNSFQRNDFLYFNVFFKNTRDIYYYLCHNRFFLFCEMKKNGFVQLFTVQILI